MSDPVAGLTQKDRQMLQRLADQAAVSVEAMLAAIIGQYFDLMRDAPGALPRDPLAGLALSARRAGGRNG